MMRTALISDSVYSSHGNITGSRDLTFLRKAMAFMMSRVLLFALLAIPNTLGMKRQYRA